MSQGRAWQPQACGESHAALLARAQPPSTLPPANPRELISSHVHLRLQHVGIKEHQIHVLPIQVGSRQIKHVLWGGGAVGGRMCGYTGHAWDGQVQASAGTSTQAGARPAGLSDFSRPLPVPHLLRPTPSHPPTSVPMHVHNMQAAALRALHHSQWAPRVQHAQGACMAAASSSSSSTHLVHKGVARGVEDGHLWADVHSVQPPAPRLHGLGEREAAGRSGGAAVGTGDGKDTASAADSCWALAAARPPLVAPCAEAVCPPPAPFNSPPRSCVPSSR